MNIPNSIIPGIEDPDPVRLNNLLLAGASSGLRFRSLKAGPFRRYPVRIYHPAQIIKHHLYKPDPDVLAHKLTSHYQPGPRSIRILAALPLLCRTNCGILSHLYLPQEKVLFQFLYPFRLDREIHLHPASRFTEVSLQSRNLLLSTLSIIAQSNATDRTDAHAAPLKFVIAKEDMHIDELDAMEEIGSEFENYDYHSCK